MSTTIYEAYRIPVMSLKELKEWVKPIRKKAEQEALDVASQFMITNAVECYDSACLMNEEEFKKKYKLKEIGDYSSPYNFINRQMSNEVNSNINGDLHLESTLVFFGLDDAILFMPFIGDLPETKKLLESLPTIEDYGYWNNTDKTDEVSEEEWEKRKTDWKLVFSESWSPMENGFSITFTKGVPHKLELEALVPSIRSAKERAYFRAKTHVKHKKGNQFYLENGQSISAMHELLTAYMETDEAKETIQSLANEYEEKLTDITSIDFIFEKFNMIFARANQ